MPVSSNKTVCTYVQIYTTDFLFLCYDYLQRVKYNVSFRYSRRERGNGGEGGGATVVPWHNWGTVKGIFQPFELGGETILIRSAVKH